MPRVEVTLPDRIDAKIEDLVEREDQFVSRDEAAEELLEMGLRAYEPESGSGGDVGMEDRMRGPEESGMGGGGIGGGGIGGPGEGPGEGPSEGPDEGPGRR